MRRREYSYGGIGGAADRSIASQLERLNLCRMSPQLYTLAPVLPIPYLQRSIRASADDRIAVELDAGDGSRMSALEDQLLVVAQHPVLL